MGDEAEKVINISLCKMASSRGFRRGGSSLHKHLLIASVLTKARSAYFENWYMGDSDYGPSPTEASESESSSSAGPSSNSGSNVPRFPDQSSSANMERIEEDDEESMNNNRVLDPRLYVEVESEIELPADILSCVEKLGSLGEVDFLHNNLSASSLVHVADEEINTVNESSSSGTGRISLEEDMVTEGSSSLPEEGNNSFSANPTSQMESQKLTYLDLDANAPVKITNNNGNDVVDSSSNSHRELYANNKETTNGLVVLSSSEHFPAKQVDAISENQNSRSNFKRRRVSEDGIEDISESEEDSLEVQAHDANERKSGMSVMNAAKRIRINDGTTPEAGSGRGVAASPSTTPVFSSPSAQSFRSKSLLYEIQEEADEDAGEHRRRWQCSTTSSSNHISGLSNEDTDPFLGNSLGQTFLKRNNVLESHKNDRRVPSTSTSSSCSSSSDEENDQSDSMEVDQITSLVQYFSFSQQKSLGNTASNPPSPTPPPSSGLIRSMSSPDLCNNLSNARCLIVTT